MEIQPAHFFTWGGTIIGLVGVWYRNQFKLERLEEKIVDMRVLVDGGSVENRRQIEAIWKWKDEHEKDSNSIRESFNKEISEIRGSMLVTNEQFKQIMTILQDIKDRVSKIEGKN